MKRKTLAALVAFLIALGAISIATVGHSAFSASLSDADPKDPAGKP